MEEEGIVFKCNANVGVDIRINDLLRECDDLGHVLGHASDRVGGDDAEAGHVGKEAVFPVRGELAGDGDGVLDGVALLGDSAYVGYGGTSNVAARDDRCKCPDRGLLQRRSSP